MPILQTNEKYKVKVLLEVIKFLNVLRSNNRLSLDKTKEKISGFLYLRPDSQPNDNVLLFI